MKLKQTQLTIASVFLMFLVFTAVVLTPKATAEAPIIQSQVMIPPESVAVDSVPDQMGPALPVVAQVNQSPVKSVKTFSIQIPSIGLDVPLDKTSLDAAGHLQVPANPTHAAWYENGPKIGENGTAVITGHMNSAAGPGVLYNLRKIEFGDEITINLTDGRTAIYKVQKSISYSQDNSFPWAEVYSTTGPGELRIITCDGIYSSKTKHYSRDLVVFASLVSIE